MCTFGLYWKVQLFWTILIAIVRLSSYWTHPNSILGWWIPLCNDKHLGWWITVWNGILKSRWLLRLNVTQFHDQDGSRFESINGIFVFALPLWILEEISLFTMLWWLFWKKIGSKLQFCDGKMCFCRFISTIVDKYYLSMLQQVVQLRKACSHPYLFDGVEPEPFEEGEHLIQVSFQSAVFSLNIMSFSIKEKYL